LDLSGLGIVLLVNQEVHFQIRVSLVERRVVEKAVGVHYLRALPVGLSKGGAGAVIVGLVQVLEQKRVIARLGAQNETHVVLLQIPYVRPV
jgi:hypothetical protein